MNHSLEYWKKRCELAEDFIEESPDDPDVTKKQWEAYQKWQDFKNSAKAAIEPEENVVDAPEAMFIQNPYIDNFRAKYPLNGEK